MWHLGDLKGSARAVHRLDSCQAHRALLSAGLPESQSCQRCVQHLTSWCSSSLARTARRWASLASDARQITATSVPTDIITLV